MARAPDTLKPYEPTLRNRISTALLGDAKATSLRGKFVKGLMGDTGLSATGLGIVDLLPFLQADEAGRQMATKGQRAAGAANLALSVIPIPAVANKLVKPVAKKATKGVSRLIGDVVGEAAPTVSKIADAMEGAPMVSATPKLPAYEAPAAFTDLGDYKINGRNLMFQGQDIGTIKLRVDPSPKLHVVIDDIQISPSMQRQGLGSGAINAIRAKAAESGLGTALTSDAMRGKLAQKDQRRLYDRLGFVKNAGDKKVKGLQPEFYDFPTPAAESGPIPVPVVGGPPRNAEGFSAPLDMSQEARMARAAEQGFGKTYYHGSPDLSGEIDTSLGGGSLGQGLYVTRMKDRASSYAGSEGAVYPVKLRGEVLDLGTPEGRAIFDTMPIEELRRQFDVIRAPGESTALKDATVRSAFDPFHPGGEARVGLPRPGDYKVGGSLPPVPVVMPRRK